MFCPGVAKNVNSILYEVSIELFQELMNSYRNMIIGWILPFFLLFFETCY